jgi:hypothetical protein
MIARTLWTWEFRHPKTHILCWASFDGAVLLVEAMGTRRQWEFWSDDDESMDHDVGPSDEEIEESRLRTCVRDVKAARRELQALGVERDALDRSERLE